MSDYRRVCIIVEGHSELNFVKNVLSPYCAERGVYVVCYLVSKPGQRGGDVKFSRTRRDIVASLQAKDNPLVCSFVDYYGIKEWPGIKNIPANASPKQIADSLNREAITEIEQSEPKSVRRYIPFLAVHEFEALLFSDGDILADYLNIDKRLVASVLSQYGSPERINNSILTAPSKRIETWNKDYVKARDGHQIAALIGISKIRKACPLFDEWLNQIGIND